MFFYRGQYKRVLKRELAASCRIFTANIIQNHRGYFTGIHAAAIPQFARRLSNRRCKEQLS